MGKAESLQFQIYMLMMFIPFAIIPMLVMVVSYLLIFNAVSARQSVVCPTYTNNNQLKAEIRKLVTLTQLLFKSRTLCSIRLRQTVIMSVTT